MNIFRQNGIESLSEMKSRYDTFNPSPQREEPYSSNNTAPVYAKGGNLMKRGGFGRHDKSQYGAQYYDVVNMHYNGVMNEMRRRGFSFEDAQRLAPFLVAQLTKEGGWRNDRTDNNYGGLRVNNGTRQLEFDSLPEFYSAYLDTLDRRWGASRGDDYNWRNATSLEDYAARLNRDDLGLHTKEQYDAYNAAHRDNPVYLYTPEWDNSNRPLSSILNDTKFRADAYLNMIYQEDPIANWDEKFTGQPPRGSDFYTHLRRGQEEGFQNWYNAYAKINGLDTNPNDPRHAYDYRGFYRSLNDWQRQSYLDSPGVHLPDTYKWPTHPTFSQESKYYNPRTMEDVGTWDGGNFKEGEYNRAMQNMDAFNLSLENIQKMLDGNQHGKGGKIHIKPENRGKFTALKKRTGHSASWFKEHGTPAQKKMAVFALNARKWKHEYGGIKF